MRNKNTNEIENMVSRAEKRTMDMVKKIIDRDTDMPSRDTGFQRDGLWRNGAFQFFDLVESGNYATFGGFLGNGTVGP